jgi:hypothetical protein
MLLNDYWAVRNLSLNVSLLRAGGLFSILS